MSGTDFTQTTNYGLFKPLPNADVNGWGGHLNANADMLDSVLYNGIGSVFNVRNHGVMMDGATDDAVALQAAINAAGTGAVIYFPPSQHSLLLSASVYPQNNQTWWAYPGSVTIAPTAGNTDAIMLWASANTSNVILSGLTFDGGGSDFANANLITQAYHVNGLTLDRCTFQNTRGMSINGSGVNDLIVRGCKFINCGNHWKTSGHWLDATQSISNTSGDGVTWGFRTRIEDCQFIECGDNINLGAIQGVQVIGCVFINSSKPWLTMTDAAAYFAAVFSIACTDVVVANNLMIGITGNALDFPGVVNATITGNIILGSGQLGIGIFDNNQYVSSYPPLRGSQNITIAGNVIENSNQWGGGVFHDGIVVAGGVSSVATNVRITSNVITDTQATKTQQHGISGSGTLSGVWVDPSNQLAGNAVGALSGLPLAGVAMDNSGNLSTATGIGMWNTTPPASKPVVTGAKGSNAALASLLSTLAAYGLITDSTTA